MKLSILLLFSLILISCDPAVSYTKIIDNHSSYDLWLIDPSEAATFQDSVLIPHNSSFQILRYEDIGGKVNFFEDCKYYPEESDSMITRIEGNDTLNLDFTINSNANWIYSVLKTGRNGSCECRLLITDNDIN